MAILADIKSHLVGNELLLADHPESIYPIRLLEGEARRCTGQRYYGIPTRIGWGVDEPVMPTIPGSRCFGSIEERHNRCDTTGAASRLVSRLAKAVESEDNLRRLLKTGAATNPV